MKLRQVKISNLMSFPYIQNLENFSGIIFPTRAKEANDVNILIGANGSGKSNFIEILKQFVQVLIWDYTFDPSFLKEKNSENYKEAIKWIPKKVSKLSKYASTANLPASIEITLELFDSDFETLTFVCTHAKRINKMIEKYSTLSYRFPEHYEEEELHKKMHNITIHAEFSEKEQTFIIDKTKLSEEEFLFLVCLQEQELLYICTRIFNEYESQDGEIM